jgi:hypothetical protein
MSEVADLSVAEDGKVGSLLKLIGRPLRHTPLTNLLTLGRSSETRSIARFAKGA